MDAEDITMATTFIDDLGADSPGYFPDYHGYRGKNLTLRSHRELQRTS